MKILRFAQDATDPLGWFGEQSWRRNEIRNGIEISDARPIEKPRHVSRVLQRVDHELRHAVRDDRQNCLACAAWSTQRSSDSAPRS